MERRAHRRWPAVAAVAVLAAALGGCELQDRGDNLVAGKTLFAGEAQCGACHTLARAGTRGQTGPNLDEAFRVAREEGYGESTFEGVVKTWILHPNPTAQIDPATGKPAARMPDAEELNLSDEQVEDIAAYVAQAVAKPGEDGGRLADVGAAQAEGTAEAENGEVEIPADPSGALAYEFANATAPPGPLTMTSPNASNVPHNIALEGGGIDEIGPVVQGGGVSEITVDVEAGEYQFYCSVPGHREGGMEGTLTVE